LDDESLVGRGNLILMHLKYDHLYRKDVLQFTIGSKL